jgi:hypothetical protein
MIIIATMNNSSEQYDSKTNDNAKNTISGELARAKKDKHKKCKYQ